MSITKRGVVIAATTFAAVGVTAGVAAGAGHSGSRHHAPKRGHEISTTVDSSITATDSGSHCAKYFHYRMENDVERSRKGGGCSEADRPESSAAKAKSAGSKPDAPESKPAGSALDEHRHGKDSCGCKKNDPDFR